MAEGETVEIPLEPPGAYLTYLEKILRHHDCHFGHLPGLQSMTHEIIVHDTCVMCLPFANLNLGVPCAKDGRRGRRRRGLCLNSSFSISAGGHLKNCS